MWGLRIFMGLRSNSGALIWACIELNLMCFVLMLLALSKDCFRAIKYFLIQALGSRVFLLSLFFLSRARAGIVVGFLLIAILLKLAMAPFQFWLVNLLGDIDWFSFFLISTVQKLMPIYVFLLTLRGTRGGVIVLGGIFAVWGGLAASEIKTLLVYSSILGLVWIISSQRFFLCLFFLRVYMVRFYLLRSMFWGLERQANSERGAWDLRSLTRRAIFISLVRIAGMPPFLGFFPKIWIIYRRWVWGGRGVLAILLLGRRVFIFIYLRFCLLHLRWSRRASLFTLWEPRRGIALFFLSVGGLALFLFLCVSLVFETKKVMKMAHVSTRWAEEG